MSRRKRLGIGLGIFLGILGALLLFLRALLPKERGVEFYVPRVGKDFYVPKVSKYFYIPRMREDSGKFPG